jgi:superfamily I DNA and/or RNA helicase
MGRLFSRLPSESLGWLLIDEAGQGIPQAAVGALQRVRRAVVVGDPLQIEPVFTLDLALTKGLGDCLKIETHWSPAEASIQTLSDRANPFGTQIDRGNEPMWVGCPLWVHRRCISPMFEIANEIAYNNRMVKATHQAGEPEFPLGDSCWIDIYGTCQGQHWVPQQGDEVIKLLTQVVETQKALPSLYVISPFKSVSFKLQDLLRRAKGRWAKEIDGVEEWIRRSVGTVHTFQGKEADAVILVLGADEGSPGATRWASSIPNILNVAATRAKYRFYIVGSKKLWSKQRYFDKASRWLLRETIKERSQFNR